MCIESANTTEFPDGATVRLTAAPLGDVLEHGIPVGAEGVVTGREGFVTETDALDAGLVIGAEKLYVKFGDDEYALQSTDVEVIAVPLALNHVASEPRSFVAGDRVRTLIAGRDDMPAGMTGTVALNVGEVPPMVRVLVSMMTGAAVPPDADGLWIKIDDYPNPDNADADDGTAGAYSLFSSDVELIEA